MKPKILLQAKDYVVIHKPSGYVVYNDTKGSDTPAAVDLVGKFLKRKVFPVHRIDKDTCGILAFALSAGAAQKFTELFRTRVVKKQYLAVVHGELPEKGVIDTALPKNKDKDVLEKAHTDYVRIATHSLELEGEMRSYSLVRLDPKTGRYHQLRRHLKSIGHPIVGDPEYGNTWNNRVFAEKFGVQRTLLSAIILHFPDREQSKMIRLQTKPDGDFQKVATHFGWKL